MKQHGFLTLIPGLPVRVIPQLRHALSLLSLIIALALSVSCEKHPGLSGNDSAATDFSCVGCHSDKLLLQSLATTEVDVQPGGG
jgi:hypothetical protein